ncbi:MAG TPA: translation initiation factor IF-2 N-terminal domain-containing protein, partial [Candidatus Eisenbacteria bacterium]
MTKLRVYQVAKDFQISSEALLEILRGLNVEVKSHMSTVEDATIAQIRQKFQKEQEAVKAEDARKRE